MMEPIKFPNPSNLPWEFIDEVSKAILELAEFGSQFEIPGQPRFLETYLHPLVDRKSNSQDAWRSLEEIDHWIAKPENKITNEDANEQFTRIMKTALSLYIEAVYATSVKEFLGYFGEAKLMHGHASGICRNEDERLVRSNTARKAAKASQVNNALYKANIIAWYELHGAEFKSVDRAAVAAAKIEPVEPRTAAKWIREHLKAQAKT